MGSCLYATQRSQLAESKIWRIWTLTLIVVSISVFCAAEEKFRGENVCLYKKYSVKPIHIRQKYQRPVHTLDLKTCKEEGEIPCNRTITTYRTTFKSTLRMRVKPVTIPGCCKGWRKRSPHDISCLQSECSRPCENGGQCEGRERCKCPTGYTGTYCHVDIDECSNSERNPCQQKCTNTRGSYTCGCADGFNTTQIMAAQATADEISKFAYEGNLGLLRLKLEENNSFASRKDGSGRSPLHWAASGGRTDVVDYLISLQVPIDERDETHWTPLIIASSAGRTQIVRNLIAFGAQINAVNQNGQSSLHYAASKDRLEICEMLLKNGADVDSIDSLGHTPLHRAASKGNLSVVKLLVSNHACLDLRDNSGCTPLHLACEDDNGEVAKLLIDHGARTDITNNDKKLAYELAPRTLQRNLKNDVDR